MTNGSKEYINSVLIRKSVVSVSGGVTFFTYGVLILTIS